MVVMRGCFHNRENYIKQPQRVSCQVHLTTTTHWQPPEHLWRFTIRTWNLLTIFCMIPAIQITTQFQMCNLGVKGRFRIPQAGESMPRNELPNFACEICWLPQCTKVCSWRTSSEVIMDKCMNTGTGILKRPLTPKLHICNCVAICITGIIQTHN